MIKSLRNPKEKEKIGFWLLNPASKFESFLLTLFFLLLPTQFGKHFWPDFTLVSGIRIDYLAPTLYVTDILIVLLFLSFAFRLFRTTRNAKSKSQKSKLRLTTKNVIFLLGLVLFFSANIIFSSRPLLSLYGILKFGELTFFIFYVAKTISTKPQLQQIAFLFGSSALGESILAILQYLNQESLNGIFYFFGERTFTGTTPGIANASINGTLILRPYATFPHPNVLAGFLLFVLVFVWSFLLQSKQRRAVMIIAIVSLLISSTALLLTFSRTAILLWIVIVCVLLFRMIFRKIQKGKERAIISVAILVMIMLTALFPLTHELYSRFSTTSLSDESVTKRSELLSASWYLIQQRPVIGVGLENFIPSLAPLQKPLPLGQYLQPVHNIFVLVFVETGVIGFGLFLWLWGAIVIHVRKSDSSVKNTFFVLLIIIFVTGFFDHYWLTLQQGQLLFAVVIGLSWANFPSRE